MMLHSPLNSSYTFPASASPEVTDWRLWFVAACAASSLRGVFCAHSSLPYGWAVQGVERLAEFRYIGTPTCAVCPPRLALVLAVLSNLLAEMAMKPTYILAHAVRQCKHGTLSPEEAQSLALMLCSSTKTVLSVLSDALCAENRIASKSDIIETVQTCAALIETAEVIQSSEA